VLKSKRGTISLEKNNGKKKKKNAKKKGTDYTKCNICPFFFLQRHIFPLFSCTIIKFRSLTSGEDSKNATENSYEGAVTEKLIVRHLTQTVLTFHNLFASMKIYSLFNII
jgi:hypothetical protein